MSSVFLVAAFEGELLKGQLGSKWIYRLVGNRTSRFEDKGKRGTVSQSGNITWGQDHETGVVTEYHHSRSEKDENASEW